MFITEVSFPSVLMSSAQNNIYGILPPRPTNELNLDGSQHYDREDLTQSIAIQESPEVQTWASASNTISQSSGARVEATVPFGRTAPHTPRHRPEDIPRIQWALEDREAVDNEGRARIYDFQMQTGRSVTGDPTPQMQALFKEHWDRVLSDSGPRLGSGEAAPN